jgi:hypothetical protein
VPNLSGIVYDPTQLARKPYSLWECPGYRELIDDDGWAVERTYECQWSEAAASIIWLRGFSYNGAGGLRRTPPAQDPYRPWLYCTKAELVDPQGVPLQDPGMQILGIGGNTIIPATVYAEKSHGAGVDVFSDGMAKIRAQFRSLPYVVRNDTQQALLSAEEEEGELGRYVERVPKYAIQGIPLLNVVKAAASTAAALKFVYNQAPVPEAGVLLMPTQSWHYIWHDVPFYPSAAIQSIMGRINYTYFDGLVGFPLHPPGTLLCQAPEIKTKRNVLGQVVFDVVWILDYRPQGWNYFPTAAGAFALATFGGGPPANDSSNLVFKEAPFELLFAQDISVALV